MCCAPIQKIEEKSGECVIHHHDGEFSHQICVLFITAAADLNFSDADRFPVGIYGSRSKLKRELYA